MKDRLGRDLDEIATIIDPLDPHAGRKNLQGIDFFHFGLNAPDGRQALLATAHQDDALDDVVVIILASDTEPRLVADSHLGDIAHTNWIAIRRSQHRVADVVDRTNKTNTTNDGGLGTDVDRIAADIDVAVIQHLQDLRQAQPVRIKLV